MRFFTTWLCVFLFTFEPLLQAQAAERYNKAEAYELFKAMSYLGKDGKVQTYGDLYVFVETNMPQRITQRYAEFLLRHRNKKLPQIEVSALKDRDGKEIPKIVFSEGGVSHTLELTQDEAVFAKINGVPLSFQDINLVTPALVKVANKYPHLGRNLQNHPVMKSGVRVLLNPHGENSTFGGNYMTPTKEEWKHMKAKDRAEFVIQVRRLWNASQQVSYGPFKNKKTAALENENSERFASLPFLHPLILKALVGAEVEAVNLNKNSSDAYYPPENSKCIIAGYIGLIQNHVCVHPADLSKKQIDSAGIGNQRIPQCDQGFKACNVSFYASANGMNCVDIDRKSKPKSGQNATHWAGICERSSPLDSTSEQKASGKMGDELSKIEIDPAQGVSADLAKKIQSAIEKDAGGKDKILELTRRYLTDQLSDANLFDKNGNIKNDQFDNIMSQVETFYTDIDSKLAVCVDMHKALNSSNKKASIDFAQQRGACQQLFRRKLAFDFSMQHLCPAVFKDSNFNVDLVKNKKGSNSGNKCEMSPAQVVTSTVAQTLPPVTTQGKANSGFTNCRGVKDGYTLRWNSEAEECWCHSEKDGVLTAEKKATSSGDNQYSCASVVNVSGEVKDDDFNWWPLIALGAGIGGYLLGKKNSDKTCPAGSTRQGNTCILPPVCDTQLYPNATLVNKTCVLPIKCEPGTSLIDKECIKPGQCPGGTEKVGDKCLIICPPNSKRGENGTCIPGFLCPRTNTVVYDLADCTEGGKTPGNDSGAGGVK